MELLPELPETPRALPQLSKVRKGPEPKLFGPPAETARQNPGMWVYVGNSWRQWVSKVRRGGVGVLRPAEDWEIASRNNRNDKADLYIRFVGEPND